MSIPTEFPASGPLPSATFSGWDANLGDRNLWAVAGSGGGAGGSVGPLGAIQASDGLGGFSGSAAATLNSGAITCASVAATGAVSGASVSGATVAATGAVTGASVAATGAVTGASVTATGAVSGASVAATGAVSGASLAASGAVTVGSAQINGNAVVTGSLTTGSFAPAKLALPYGAGMGSPGSPVSPSPFTNFQVVGNKVYLQGNSATGLGQPLVLITDPALGQAFPFLTNFGAGIAELAYSVVSGQWRCQVQFLGNTAECMVTYI